MDRHRPTGLPASRRKKVSAVALVARPVASTPAINFAARISLSESPQDFRDNLSLTVACIVVAAGTFELGSRLVEYHNVSAAFADIDALLPRHSMKTRIRGKRLVMLPGVLRGEWIVGLATLRGRAPGYRLGLNPTAGSTISRRGQASGILACSPSAGAPCARPSRRANQEGRVDGFAHTRIPVIYRTAIGVLHMGGHLSVPQHHHLHRGGRRDHGGGPCARGFCHGRRRDPPGRHGAGLERVARAPRGAGDQRSRLRARLRLVADRGVAALAPGRRGAGLWAP